MSNSLAAHSRQTPLIKDIEFLQFCNYVMFGEEIPQSHAGLLSENCAS
jgi:hypothetical protein